MLQKIDKIRIIVKDRPKQKKYQNMLAQFKTFKLNEELPQIKCEKRVKSSILNDEKQQQENVKQFFKLDNIAQERAERQTFSKNLDQMLISSP